MRIFKEMLKAFDEQKIEIAINAISEINEDVTIEKWIEFLNEEYHKNFEKMGEAKGLGYQEFENKCSEIACMQREAKQYLELKKER